MPAGGRISIFHDGRGDGRHVPGVPYPQMTVALEGRHQIVEIARRVSGVLKPSIALSIVCRPTRKAARISVRTEREALEYAVTPASARLISSARQTRPIRRNRSDTGATAERWHLSAGGCHYPIPRDTWFAQDI